MAIDLPNLYEEEEEQSSNANHINTQGYDSDSLASNEE